MTKYTIEYKRTVRVRQYETLTIGMTSEFQYEDMTPDGAKELVKKQVDVWIINDLDEMRKEE